MNVPALLITGPVGVGKTTVAGEISELLAAAKIPHGVIDFDALTAVSPAPADDRFNSGLGFSDLACVWANYRQAGAERLVIARCTGPDEMAGFRAAINGSKITLVRLRADVAEMQRRVRRRDQATTWMDWHVNRTAEQAPVYDGGVGEDHVVIPRDALRATSPPTC